MLNKPRKGMRRSMLARGTLAALLGMTLGCGASSPAASTPTRVTPGPVAPGPVAPSGVYTVTAGTNTVAPGAQLSVTWTAAIGYSEDSVSLFRTGDPNTAPRWSQSTAGTTSGAFTLSAPIQQGQYEFRYLLEDLSDAARSSVVTVGVGL
jgi:hypothetical protein